MTSGVLMSVQLNPYLSFRDSAAAALDFYQSVFGGEVTVSRFADAGISQDPSEQDKVMHGMLVGDNGLVLMAADTPDQMDLVYGSSISMSLSGDDTELLTGYWKALSTDGTITVPLEQSPFGDAFGMCTDSFGVDWLVNILRSQE
jgi:PhnB protein